MFQGDCARDQYGKAAAYQDLGASPAGIFDVNANICWGSQPGHRTKASDAITAYLQSFFKGAETNVAIPVELWPQEWHKLGFKPYGDEQPMCRLNKALYAQKQEVTGSATLTLRSRLSAPSQ